MSTKVHVDSQSERQRPAKKDKYSSGDLKDYVGVKQHDHSHISRFHMACCAVNEGYAIFGGHDQFNFYSKDAIFREQLVLLNSDGSVRSAVSPGLSPEPLAGMSMDCGLGQVFIYGGRGPHTRGLFSNLWMIQQDSGQSTNVATKGRQPPGRARHASCIVDSQFYVHGGHCHSSRRAPGMLIKDFWMLDLSTLQWSEVPCADHGPCARFGHCMVHWGGCLYIFGGTDGREVFNDTWRYDHGQWTLVEFLPDHSNPKTMLRPRYGAKGVVFDDCIFMYGGWGSDDDPLPELLIMDFCTLTYRLLRVLVPNSTRKVSVPALGDTTLLLHHPGGELPAGTNVTGACLGPPYNKLLILGGVNRRKILNPSCYVITEVSRTTDQTKMRDRPVVATLPCTKAASIEVLPSPIAKSELSDPVECVLTQALLNQADPNCTSCRTLADSLLGLKKTHSFLQSKVSDLKWENTTLRALGRESAYLKLKNQELANELETFQRAARHPFLGSIVKRAVEMSERHWGAEACMVCSTARRTTAFAPCGHMLCCAPCATKLVESDGCCQHCSQRLSGCLTVKTAEP
ncbi:MAG: uncharacterized protein KVP18_004911 [Porospora cf. gigantea A]|uniref:uncharacterized protein n=1 Tax=Porospora cf. gigantea A TaxID=2853593 RepID=UPI003559BEDD|nr:MAG: hypothetical protein KVP18_004911 [Porospora cf. gigantea A]